LNSRSIPSVFIHSHVSKWLLGGKRNPQNAPDIDVTARRS